MSFPIGKYQNISVPKYCTDLPLGSRIVVLEQLKNGPGAVFKKAMMKDRVKVCNTDGVTKAVVQFSVSKEANLTILLLGL